MDSQVRRTVRYEAVITALMYPVPTLIILLVLAAIAGVVAAIGPARRASRLDVLRALAYE